MQEIADNLQPKDKPTYAVVLFGVTRYFEETCDQDFWKNNFDYDEIDKKKSMKVSASRHEELNLVGYIDAEGSESKIDLMIEQTECLQVSLKSKLTTH